MAADLGVKMTLTLRARYVLEQLANDDLETQEIVCSGGTCWIGLERTSYAIVRQLLRDVLINFDDLGGAEHYEINESGRRFLQGLPPYRDSTGDYHWSFTEMLAREEKTYALSPSVVQ